MGLLSKLFGNHDKKEVKESVVSSTNLSMDVEKEISFLLEVLEHLGLLDVDKIEKSLMDSPNYNKSILARLMIKVNEENISNLKKYYNFHSIGYGKERIRIYKNRLEEYSREKIKQGKNREEVIEELIAIVRTEIENYEVILKNLNREVARVEEEAKSNSENLAMIDFLMNQYQEQELGYPVHLENRIKSMANELSQLPYGGYGDEEIELFIDAANKIMEEGKINHEETSHTLSRIQAELFYPKKNRYMADLDTLNKKMAMISDSTYLSDIEKEQNKMKTITEFNQMNGHKIGVKETIARFKKNLEEFEYGGFGSIITDIFEKRANDIQEEGINTGLADEEIIKLIQGEYQKLMQEYNVHLTKLKNDIKDIEEDHTILNKKRRIDDIVLFFHDEMGHPIDYQKRIHQMCDELLHLENGGYSEDVVSKFREESLEKAKNISSHDELANCMKQIHRKCNELMDAYEKENVRFNEEKEKILQSDLDEEEKNNKIERLRKGFLVQFGHIVDYEKLIEDNVKVLGSLDKGGYGKKTLDEYRHDCHVILDLESDSVDAYEQIQKKFHELKDHYVRNLEIFREWKDLQLNNKKGQEKIELEKDLDTKISYMLSLSPKELYEYYMEDDRKKKAEAYRHNYMAAYRYLAREEARKKKNQSLYERRLDELKKGKQMYSKEDIEKATKKLETSFDENMKEEDRIISLIEYIDSTLFRQMLYVETSLAHKKEQTKI